MNLVTALVALAALGGLDPAGVAMPAAQPADQQPIPAGQARKKTKTKKPAKQVEYMVINMKTVLVTSRQQQPGRPLKLESPPDAAAHDRDPLPAEPTPPRQDMDPYPVVEEPASSPGATASDDAGAPQEDPAPPKDDPKPPKRPTTIKGESVDDGHKDWISLMSPGTELVSARLVPLGVGTLSDENGCEGRRALMPYDSISDLPKEQVDQYSRHGKEAFLEAFNSALDTYDGDESRAFAVAHSAAQKANDSED